MQHAEAALCIGNSLPTGAADSSAHVTIDDATQRRHAGEIVHARADEQLRIECRCSVNKTINFLGKVLAIGVENNDVSELPIQPVTKPGLDRLALATILRMNNYFCASFTRARRRLIVGSIIDHEHMIELLTGSANDVADMFLFAIGRNDRRNGWPILHARARVFHCQRTTGWKSAA